MRCQPGISAMLGHYGGFSLTIGPLEPKKDTA